MQGPLVFDIDGHPAPQGSKRHVGKGVMVEDNPRTKPWRAAVALQVRQQLPRGHQPIDGPVQLVVFFTMPAPRRVPGARAFPATKAKGMGDEDKLVRAICDALTAANVWADDSRVVRTISGTDFPGAPGFRDEPGARVIVAPITDSYLADLAPTIWAEEVLAAETPGHPTISVPHARRASP